MCYVSNGSPPPRLGAAPVGTDGSWGLLFLAVAQAAAAAEAAKAAAGEEPGIGERPETPEELEFEDDDGTTYVWDTKWVRGAGAQGLGAGGLSWAWGALSGSGG